MAHKNEVKEKAERLYVKEDSSVIEIADKLDIPAQTIYRWMSQVKGKEGFDWEQRRGYFALSPKALADLYAKKFRRWVSRIQDDTDLMANPQIADAISKHISTLKKLDPRFNYSGAILDVIHISDKYLEENAPKLRKRMKAHWPEIQKGIEEIATA